MQSIIAYRVEGDEVALEEEPFRSLEDARFAIASGMVVPCDRLDMAAFRAACATERMRFEIVTVRALRPRETGQEADAELLVEEFQGVRETWMQRLPPKAVRPPAPMVRKAAG